jgi:Mg2+/Co2+ transporter CorB
VGLLPVLAARRRPVATVVLTPLMLVFGEVIPKAVAREWATALISLLFRVIELATRLCPR